MSSRRGTALLEDIFEILEIDPDGKKFDRGTILGFVSELIFPTLTGGDRAVLFGFVH
jgi:hypothetical protein